MSSTLSSVAHSGPIADLNATRMSSLMLRVAKSKYVGKRDKSLQKVKTFYDAEAKVVGYEPGKVRFSRVLSLSWASAH